jgi:hypothetical protein
MSVTRGVLGFREESVSYGKSGGFSLKILHRWRNLALIFTTMW